MTQDPKTNVLAVDIGAGSGRLILGQRDGSSLTLKEVGRFIHHDSKINGILYWNFPEIYNHVLVGIREARKLALRLDGIGFDTFAPDFVCFDKRGALAGNMLSYRNFQDAAFLKSILAQRSRDDFWEIGGNEPLSFGWLAQLFYLEQCDLYSPGNTLIPMPLGNALAYLLSSVPHTDWTQVSISMLSDRKLRNWSPELTGQFIRKPFRLPDMMPCGTVLDTMKVAGETDRTAVVNVGSHDTACANSFLADHCGTELVINAGTWISVGTVCEEPLVNRYMIAHSLNNYGLPDGRTLVCRLSIGMGLVRSLYECMASEGYAPSYAVLGELADTSHYSDCFNPGNPGLFATDRPFPRIIRDVLAAEGKPAPESFPDVVRSVYLSLAENIAGVTRALEESTGRAFHSVFIGGGGVQDAYFLSLVEEHTGLKAVKMPAESTAIGSVFMQLAALGVDTNKLEWIGN